MLSSAVLQLYRYRPFVLVVFPTTGKDSSVVAIGVMLLLMARNWRDRICFNSQSQADTFINYLLFEEIVVSF